MSPSERDQAIEILSEILRRVQVRQAFRITFIPASHWSWEATGNIKRRSP